jgi:hypothetical protein
MGGLVKEIIDICLLRNASGVHDNDPVSDASHHTEVMGNEHERAPRALLYTREYVQNLSLHGHVERSGRLVSDDEIRLVRDAHRDECTLPHAPGELVRVVVDP